MNPADYSALRAASEAVDAIDSSHRAMRLETPAHKANELARAVRSLASAVHHLSIAVQFQEKRRRDEREEES